MGNELVVTPRYWHHRGEAMLPGREKSLLVFGGIPGETAEVRLQHKGRNQDTSEWLRSRNPSEDRVEPPCPKYAPCGGCPWMHLNEKGQEEAHRDLIKLALRDAGLENLKLGTWHACPDGQADYRHVAKMGIERSDRDRVRLGAWARNSRRIVPIPHCNVVAPVLRKTMKSVAHHTIELDIFPYDAESGRGVLRTVVMRASRTTGKVVVVLVCGRNTARLRQLAEAIEHGVPEVSGVWLHLNETPGNSIYSRDEDSGEIRMMPLGGAAEIEETLNGVTYEIGPGDFFQTNPSVAEVLYQRVMDRMEPTERDTFVDLYCGVGGLALQAAQAGAGFVYGIEGIEGAIVRARSSARKNKLTAEFASGWVELLLPDLGKRLGGGSPMIAVNPARRGLEEGVIKELIDLKPKRLAYISCNPRALARDLLALQEGGLKVVGDIELFDMFPNTPHVETLVILEGEVTEDSGRRAPKRKAVKRGKARQG